MPNTILCAGTLDSTIPCTCIFCTGVRVYYTGKYYNIANCTGNPYVFDRSYWLVLYSALCY